MPEKTGKKEKDFAFFPYDASHEKAIKLYFLRQYKIAQRK